MANRGWRRDRGDTKAKRSMANKLHTRPRRGRPSSPIRPLWEWGMNHRCWDQADERSRHEQRTVADARTSSAGAQGRRTAFYFATIRSLSSRLETLQHLCLSRSSEFFFSFFFYLESEMKCLLENKNLTKLQTRSCYLTVLSFDHDVILLQLFYKQRHYDRSRFLVSI